MTKKKSHDLLVVSKNASNFFEILHQKWCRCYQSRLDCNALPSLGRPWTDHLLRFYTKTFMHESIFANWREETKQMCMCDAMALTHIHQFVAIRRIQFHLFRTSLFQRRCFAFLIYLRAVCNGKVWCMRLQIDWKMCIRSLLWNASNCNYSQWFVNVSAVIRLFSMVWCGNVYVAKPTEMGLRKQIKCIDILMSRTQTNR